MSRRDYVVSGSREELSDNDKLLIYATLADYGLDGAEGRDRFHHGAASGVDTYAADLAAKWGMQIVAYPVAKEEWKTLGKKAGPLRNRAMLDTASPDMCFAFPRPESRGTKDFINAALERHLPLMVVWLPSAAEWQ